ncbi:MAG TPA: PH domain-containing protein [Patescibacteria group bacterium]|nr:PH domain-containing protein [Patescibacteria group bacterium]
MSANETQNSIDAKVWKAIAQSDIDISAMEKADMDNLIELITDTILVEVDSTLDKSEAADKDAAQNYFPPGEDSNETVLWQGRPFLSFSEHYLVTNQRVRIIKGLLGKKRKDIELIRIQDLDQTQTLRERSLNLGDITIHSHDKSDPVITLNNVRDPEQVHEILRQAILSARKQSKLTFQEEM